MNHFSDNLDNVSTPFRGSHIFRGDKNPPGDLTQRTGSEIPADLSAFDYSRQLLVARLSAIYEEIINRHNEETQRDRQVEREESSGERRDGFQERRENFQERRQSLKERTLSPENEMQKLRQSLASRLEREQPRKPADIVTRGDTDGARLIGELFRELSRLPATLNRTVLERYFLQHLLQAAFIGNDRCALQIFDSGISPRGLLTFVREFSHTLDANELFNALRAFASSNTNIGVTFAIFRLLKSKECSQQEQAYNYPIVYNQESAEKSQNCLSGIEEDEDDRESGGDEESENRDDQGRDDGEERRDGEDGQEVEDNQESEDNQNNADDEAQGGVARNIRTPVNRKNRERMNQDGEQDGKEDASLHPGDRRTEGKKKGRASITGKASEIPGASRDEGQSLRDKKDPPTLKSGRVKKFIPHENKDTRNAAWERQSFSLSNFPAIYYSLFAPEKSYDNSPEPGDEDDSIYKGRSPSLMNLQEE